MKTPLTKIVLLLTLSLLSTLPTPAQILDPSFNPGPSSDVYALALQSDGKILVGGSFSRIASVARANFVRLHADGSYDTTFDLPVSGTIYAIAVQPDGKIIIGGLQTLVGGQNRGRLVRINPNGTIDSSFNPVVTGNAVRAILLQPDGKIVVGGDITAIGGRPRFGLARLQADGSLDTTLVPEATGTSTPTASPGVFALARQPDGRIVVGGQFTNFGGESRRGLARVNADGTLDTTFPSTAFSNTSGLAIQRDGKILLGGGFSVPGPVVGRVGVARLHVNGEIDTTFEATAAGSVRVFVEQPDGKIVAGGTFTNFSNVPRGYLVRLQPDGRTDDTFPFEASGILNTTPGVYALVGSADGGILVGGSFTSISGQNRSGLARFVPPVPKIVTAPVAIFATAGTAFTLTATVSGASPTYQWRKNGLPVPGATQSSLTINSAQFADAGQYDLVSTNAFGTVTTTAVPVAVGIAPVVITQPSAVSAVAGQSATLVVIASATPPTTFQWQRNGVNISGATVGNFTLAPVTAADAGNYTCVIADPFGSVTSLAASLTVAPASRLTNLSVRTNLATAQSLIVGYVVGGGSTDVLVRAAGPALEAFGIPLAMPDPRIELYKDSTKMLENDNWPGILHATMTGTGAFPFGTNSKDAALLHPATGAYSVLASGSTTGVVLVEAYDAANSGSARLINLSARNHVGTDADILIAGFTLTGGGTKRILIRAIGPTLGGVPFNVPGTLADPMLVLYDARGTRLAENDNWDAALAAVFTASGAFGLAPNSRDAALLVTLSAGSYTAQVSGIANTTGTALVEVYEVP